MTLKQRTELIMKYLVAAGVLEIAGKTRERGRLVNAYRQTAEFQKLSKQDAIEKMAKEVWLRATPEERRSL